MQIRFIWIGKSKYKAYDTLIDLFVKRLKYYAKCHLDEVKAKKGIRRKEETELLLRRIDKSDFVILLDEKGRSKSSQALADYLQTKMNQSVPRLCFVICGAYGAGQQLKERADFTLSLSEMTFTHDMARIILLEQVYRAFTILKGEKYHND